MDDEVIEKAIHSSFKDFEDATQYFSAIATNCDVIITRNEKDFKNALIPVMNAESYLQTIGSGNKKINSPFETGSFLASFRLIPNPRKNTL